MTPSPELLSSLQSDIDFYEAKLHQHSAGEIDAADFKSIRVPRGVYEQRRSGTFMVRIRITGGTLSPAQAQKIAELANQYGRSDVHLTTRQDLQLHNVAIADTATIMRELIEAGLSPRGGGGNTLRNVAACPFAGFCSLETFDVRSCAEAVTDYLLQKPDSFTLPRKYKIAFSGCSRDCALAGATDLGFIAQKDGSEPGFAVYSGGGLGARSRVGKQLFDTQSAADILRISEAVRRVFNRIGDRKRRANARLRFAVERIGLDAYRQQVQEELAKLQDEAQPFQLPALPADHASHSIHPDRCRIHNGARIYFSDDQSHAAVVIHAVFGLLPSAQFAALAELAARHSAFNELRTMNAQNLIIPAVPAESIDTLLAEVKALDPALLSTAPLQQLVSCTGAATCRLGLCLSRNLARAGADTLQQMDLDAELLKELNIHISGCPNNCGQHSLAALGFSGATVKKDDKRIPVYEIHLGGVCQQNQTQLGSRIAKIAAKAVPDFLRRLVSDYLTNRQAGEQFLKYIDRKESAYFATMAAEFSAMPSYAENPDFYRDWGCDRDYSLAGLGESECGTAVTEADLQRERQMQQQVETAAVEELDLTGVPCPLNFVRAKVRMESLSCCQILTVILDDGEPRQRLPESFRNEGYQVVEETNLGNGHWRIRIRQKGSCCA